MPTSPLARRAPAAVLVALLLLAGCGGDDGSASDDDTGSTSTSAPATEPADDPTDGPADEPAEGPVAPEELAADADRFHEPPDPLPAGPPGTLLRTQPSDLTVTGAEVTRVMYLSESMAGDPIAVTGLLVVPTGPAPEGGWRLLTHGHGSTGLADVCAPSVDDAQALELQVLGERAAALGFVVVSTDYEGLGTPGVHPALVGVSEGRSVLDAARAARQVPGLELAEGTAIAGYSQGGHAALWAQELAAEWAPELTVTGTVAGAPGAIVAPVRDGHASTRADPPDAAIAATIIAGVAAAHPEVDPSEVLTDAGLAYVATLDTSCRGDLADPTTPLFRVDPTTVEPWRTLLEGSEPGTVATGTPTLVVHSQEDLWVPPASVDALLARMCEAGQVVERRTLPTGDHVTAAVPTYEQGLQWLLGLETGTAPGSSC